MNPAQLSATIVAALTTLSEDGRLTLPDGVPADGGGRASAEQGARGLRDQRRAAAGQEGRAEPARARRDARRASCVQADGHQRGRRRRPGVPEHHRRGRRPGPGRGRRRGRRCGVRPHRGARRARRSTWSSSRPTRPGRCTSGHTRWAVLGDAIGRVLSAAGAEVTREFYINDRGVQMNHFADSIIASALGLPKPEDGYAGAYIDDLAKAVEAASPGIFDLPADERLVAVRAKGYELQLAAQQEQLEHVQHPLRRLVLRAVPARVRLGARDAAAAAGPRARLLRGRRAVDAHHRLRRRQGPGADQVRRRADLLRLRHRLLPEQAGSRLRPLHLPARRRPPRLRRPAAGDGRLRRRRPRRRPSTC